MSLVQDTILEVIDEIMENPLPYDVDLDDNSHSGASQEVSWNGETLLTSGGTTNCVGATTEVLVRLFKKLNLESDFTLQKMKEFRRHCFITNYDEYLWGIASAVVDLGVGEYIDNIEEAQLGDVAQLWHVDLSKPEGAGQNKQYWLGHSVIILGQDTYNGKPAVKNFSASEYLKGHGVDTHVHNRKIKTYRREWKIARLFSSN